MTTQLQLINIIINSRPIPFALRNKAREHSQAMLKYAILEESHSEYINTVTLVVRERKAVRICLDARRSNKQMVADRAKIMPISELVQSFCCAKYIASLNLSSASLKVHFEQPSRQWTEYQFENNVYKFKTVSYGLKNSLAAFIRYLEKVLGNCGPNNNLVMYVDDLLVVV